MDTNHSRRAGSQVGCGGRAGRAAAADGACPDATTGRHRGDG
jgi:hypothetical protein